MPLLPGQLERQRAQALRDLTELCTIERPTELRDDTGEWRNAFAAVATLVPCKIVNTRNISTGIERLRLDAMGQVTQWQVILPADYPITSADRITVTSGSSAGRVFAVSQLPTPHTNSIRTQVEVTEVNYGSA